ncbi:MAG: acyltransferase family protein [Bacteroidota bacterium]
MERNRLIQLDYLRGLMALAVMVFHYDKWTTGTWNADTPQGKLGVYAVSSFFIISGMALAHRYAGTLPRAWKSFATRRVQRIFPMLWLATIATLVIDDHPRSWQTILLNLSGLFGFADASADIATGAWSIGCELVYYCFFPLLLWTGERKKWIFLLLWMAAAACGLARAFFPPFSVSGTSQTVWWPYYVQAPGQAWFFITGAGLSLFSQNLKVIPEKYWKWLMLAGMSVFLLMPTGGDPLSLVAGSGMVILSVSTVMAVTGWIFGTGKLPGILDRVLAWLGDISYALYLLHPLVYRGVKAIGSRIFDAPLWLWALTAAVVSFAVAHLAEKKAARSVITRPGDQ